jgi:hypothetical protein
MRPASDIPPHVRYGSFADLVIRASQVCFPRTNRHAARNSAGPAEEIKTAIINNFLSLELVYVAVAASSVGVVSLP